MKVTVLGAGSWGTTFASLCSRRNEVVLWTRRPELARQITRKRANEQYLPGFRLPSGLRATADLAAATRHAEVLVVAVPSDSFRSVVQQARPAISAWIPVVSLTKALERNTLLRMTEILYQELPGHPAVALTGPNLAKEIMSGMAAAAVVATEDASVATALQDVFSREFFRVYTNHDVIGCEIGGALKNVVAIATGIAQGLSVGDNTRAAVMTRGLAELTQLGIALGAEPATLAGLAGMGDLVATCSSPQSRNRWVGEQLGRGRSVQEVLAEMGQVAEGVRTVEAAVDLADRHGCPAPIIRGVQQVVQGRASAREAYAGLLRSPAGHEADPG